MPYFIKDKYPSLSIASTSLWTNIRRCVNQIEKWAKMRDECCSATT
jgi:hypothetical protein